MRKTFLGAIMLVVVAFGAGTWFAWHAITPVPVSSDHAIPPFKQASALMNGETVLPPTFVGPPGLFGVPVPMIPIMINPPMSGSGVVAGINVIGHNPSGILTISRSATTTSFPVPVADKSLDASTMRIVSINPFVLVQKPDGVHIEYVYDSGIVAPDTATLVPVPLPRLVPGGVIFNDQYNSERVYGLGDGGIIAGLPVSDTLRFATSSTRYLVDARGVYFITYTTSVMQAAKDFTVVRIQDADPNAFFVLYPDANFARDATHYFLNNKPIADITPQTAPLVSYSAYADSTWLYQIGFAKDSSEQYTETRYRDTGTITKKLLKDVYYRKLADVDAKNYQYTQYAIKPDGVWYGTMKVMGADNNSFELVVGFTALSFLRGGMSFDYARDANHIYYQGVQIPGTDRETFLPVTANPAYGADRTQVFFQSITMPNAEPATFEPLWYPAYEGCLLGMYAKDARTVFYKSQVVKGADSDSFKSLYGEYGRDKKGIYFQGVFHAEIDLQSFVAPGCNYG